MLKQFGNFRISIIALACAALIQTCSASELPDDYDQLILTTRGDLSAGQLQPAIAQLRQWHSDYPHSLRITYDLAALLDKAGDYQAGMTYFYPVLETNAPAYAFAAIAHSALKTGQFQQAQAAYQLQLLKTPDDVEAKLGYIYALMGRHMLPAALDYARLQTGDGSVTESNLPLHIALAEIYFERRDFLEAALIYQQVLVVNPELRYARRQLVFSLSQADVQNLARTYADAWPDAFDDDEKHRLAHDDAALTIRFGQAQQNVITGTSRYNTTDIAIAQNAAVAATFGPSDANQFDRIIALAERSRMAEVIQIYEALIARKVTPPLYVNIAVADAYLYLERPEEAIGLYQACLPELQKGDREAWLNTQISLIYAYSEAGQFAAADTLAEQLAGNAPHDPDFGAGIVPDNVELLRVNVVAAQLQISHDRLDAAQQRLAQLRKLIPFSSDIRISWASLQFARDQPRKARDDYAMMALDHPDSLDAALGKAGAVLSLNELAEAQAELAAVKQQFPPDRATQRLSENIDIYASPYYRLDTTYGNGISNAAADSLTDASIYSAPFGSENYPWMNHHFRLMAHLESAEGQLSNSQSEMRSRMGVGFDYRSSDFSLDAEVNHTLEAPQNNGVAVALNWTASDTWHELLSFDSNVINLPAQALAEGLTAREVDGKVDWSQNESHKAGVDLSSTRFSDDNLRTMLGAWWMNRLISGPVFKFDTVLDLGTSHNTETGRAYFNPVRDDSAELEMKAEWLTWQRYQRSMKQRVDFTVGEYWQSGFNAGATAGIRYEHDWRLERDFEIAYGVGRNFQPYDGLRQYRDYIFLNLSGHIK